MLTPVWNPARRRLLLCCTAAALACLAASGCGPEWKIVRQSAANPLSGVRSLAVEPLHLDNLRIGNISEAEWLAKKDAKQQQSWQTDKAEMGRWFLEALTEGAGKRGLQIVPATGAGAAPHLRLLVPRIEPGFYAGIVSGAAEIEARLQLVQGDTVLDEVTYVTKISAFSLGERVRHGGKRTGETAAEYLASRAGAH